MTTSDDFRAGAREHLFVRRVLPFHEVFDDSEEPLALLVHGFLCREFLGMAGRIVHQLGEQYRPAGCQRPSRPPKVQRGGVAMADRFFSRRFGVDRIKRKCNFDEFFLNTWVHALASCLFFLAL